MNEPMQRSQIAQAIFWVEEEGNRVRITEAQELPPGATAWYLIADEAIAKHPLLGWLFPEAENRNSLPVAIVRSIAELTSLQRRQEGYSAYGTRGLIDLQVDEEDPTRFWLHFEFEQTIAPLIRKGIPAIRSLKDLCDYWGADDPADLNRQTHSRTKCGASISLYLEDGTAIHNGKPGWNKLEMDAPILGFTIQTIVEGGDATVDSDLFEIPCTKKYVDNWVTEMEAQAQILWEGATEMLNDLESGDA